MLNYPQHPVPAPQRCAHASAWMARSEDDLWELVLSFHLSYLDQTQVVNFGSKHLQLLSHLTGLSSSFQPWNQAGLWPPNTTMHSPVLTYVFTWFVFFVPSFSFALLSLALSFHIRNLFLLGRSINTTSIVLKFGTVMIYPSFKRTTWPNIHSWLTFFSPCGISNLSSYYLLAIIVFV